MTSLLPAKGSTRTSDSGRSAPADPPRPLVVSGLTATGHAAGLGLLAVTVLVLVGWATAADSGASASEALRTSVQVWLLGHGTALAIPGGRFSLAPLGLTALPGLLLYLAASRAARAASVGTVRAAVSLTAVLAGSYAVLSALLALLARTGDVRPLPVSAFLAGGTLALAAGGAGATRAAGCWPVLWRRLPAPVALAVTGGMAAFATLVAGGALVAATSLAVHGGSAVDLMRGLETGTLGGVLLFLACLLYLPTAVVWAASFAAGPGFALGAGTSVAPWGSELGAAPAFPLLAALPGGDGSMSYVVLAIPLAAGILAGLLVERRDRLRVRPELHSWRRASLIGLGCGAATGLAFLVLTMAASGSAGPGRLGHAGLPWWSGFAIAVETGSVAAATLLVRRRVAGRDG